MQDNQSSRLKSRDARKKRRMSSKDLAQSNEINEPETGQMDTSDEQQNTATEVEEPVAVIEVEEPVAAPRTSTQLHKHSRNAFRASVAVVGGRTAGALSRRLRLGGGTSIAGIVAQRLYPDIIEHLSTQFQQGSILVTGTNGKTTTSGFIAAILSDAGLRVWRNREGSNLLRGIAGALVIRTRPNGRLRRSGQATSIFEVDEAIVPQAIQIIPTRVIVFTNLFRDQLDRFGEVDSIAERWKKTIRELPAETILVLNADDPAVASLGDYFAGRVIYFGIEDQSLNLENQDGANEHHQVIDTRTCPHCGTEYIYTLHLYSHLGHYRCPQCKRGRPLAAVQATKVENESFDRLHIQVETPRQKGHIIVPLPGLYNVYNVLAAIAVAQALDIAWEPIVSGIEQFKPAFGRGERVQVAGRTARMLLAKNPTGFNEVMRTLFADGNKRHVLFILNDNIADGKDVSWIWDVDFEQALEGFASLAVAGTRARDLVLRLKYAGLDPKDILVIPAGPLRVERREERAQSQSYGIAHALDRAISQTPEGETLFIVPTYTGLLEIHRELERRGLTPHYWEEPGP
jgi:UDP-N-acetylmuramyl tripeptide synthase